MAGQDAAAALTDIGVLFSESWQRFVSRWGLLMGVAALSGLAALAGGLAPFALIVPFWHAFPHLLLLLMAALAGVFLAFWAYSWGQVAMFEAALAEPAPDFRACYRAGRDKVGEFSWVYILFLVLVFAGLCLFVVPGVFLGVALVFSPFVFVAEGDTGFSAMEKSYHYVEGRWSSVLLRLILVAAVAYLPSWIPLVGWLATLLLAPWALVLMAVIYLDLRRSKEAQAAFVPSAKRRAFIAAALAGLVIPAFAAVALVRAARNDWPVLQAMARGGLDPATGQKWLSSLGKYAGLSPAELGSLGR